MRLNVWSKSGKFVDAGVGAEAEGTVGTGIACPNDL